MKIKPMSRLKHGVQVYWNIRRRCWSVRDKATGLVTEHSLGLVLRNVRFVVQQGGRARVRREKVKNIHAFVEGERVETEDFDINGEQVTYNPYNEHDSFIRCKDRSPIFYVPEVTLTNVFSNGCRKPLVIAREVKIESDCQTSTV